MRAALPPAAQDKPIEVWSQDEARVGQQGTLTYVWAERGSRPPVPRDSRHHSVWLFGAVCPARGAAAGLVLPQVCAEAMSLRLGEISTQVAPGAHAVIVLDGAGWHQQGGRLKMPGNLTLLPLPPYAPELNGAESLREYLRSNRLSHKVLGQPRRYPRRLLRRLERPRRLARAHQIPRQSRLGIGQCLTPLV